MISLVMTTYNGLKYISEQLESIKNQTVLSVTFLLWMFICMLLRKEKQNDERI